jgi:chaperonin GroEL (HSP60 family)
MATEVNLLVVRDLVRIIRPTTGPVHREIGSVSGSISKIVMASVTVTSQRSLEIQRPFRASTPTATLLANTSTGPDISPSLDPAVWCAGQSSG